MMNLFPHGPRAVLGSQQQRRFAGHADVVWAALLTIATPASRGRLAVRLFLLALFSFFPLASHAAESKSKPNILFLFTDDQRADTIAALGNPVIKTPNLDSLARTGFSFRNAYCLGGNSGAVCTPSRNMLLSGKTYFRWTGQQAPPTPPNFPLSMKDAGYETYHEGKKGNTAINLQALFEINKYLPDDEEDRKDGEPGRTIVDDAISFLKTRKTTRPFFLYLAFANPHDPRVAAPKYLELYDPAKIPLPRNFLPMHPFDNGEMAIRDELLAPWPRTETEIRRQLREYYAVISGLDYHIGRLLTELRQHGLLENTIIIFSSDQGLAMGSHGLMGKQNLYDAGMKVPLIFSGPGIPKGQSDALVYLHDIYPTVCDLIGAPVPSGLDGVSFAPVLRQEASSESRDSLFFAYLAVQRAIRDRDWKLIRYPQINRTQLFNLKNDPDEIHDLADEPSQVQRIAQMMAELQTWQRRLGDAQSLTATNPKDGTFTPPTGEALQKLLSRWKMTQADTAK